MSKLSNLVSKLKPSRGLRYGRDFKIEPLNLGTHNKKEEVPKWKILLDEKFKKDPEPDPSVEDPDPTIVEEEADLVVVKGFTDQVQDYMKKKGWTHS